MRQVRLDRPGGVARKTLPRIRGLSTEPGRLRDRRDDTSTTIAPILDSMSRLLVSRQPFPECAIICKLAADAKLSPTPCGQPASEAGSS
jgi:hypothetical protein